jgi:hypothetical protein
LSALRYYEQVGHKPDDCHLYLPPKPQLILHGISDERLMFFECPVTKGVFGSRTKWNVMSWFHSERMGWFHSYVQFELEHGMGWFRSCIQLESGM